MLRVHHRSGFSPLVHRPASSPAEPASTQVEDTVLFVLNSAGETNMARPLIEEVKERGFEAKVLHFRHNSKSILTGEEVLEEDDFVDGTNRFWLPRVGSAFSEDLEPGRIKKLVGTPHHAYSQLAFAQARERGIPVVAAVDLGVPPPDFKFRHTFYRALTYADEIVVPDETVKQRLTQNIHKSGYQVEAPIHIGGNPGFESFRHQVDFHKSRGDQYRRELGIGEQDLVMAFSSQPTPFNGAVLHLLGQALKELSQRQPEREVHLIFSPHARDLDQVGLKNLFGTETSLSIADKLDVLNQELGEVDNVKIHLFDKSGMKKATALSDVVVTESSTTAYEAAHADIPAVFARAPEQGLGTTFPDYQRIPVVNESGALADAVEAAAASPPQGLSQELAQVVGTDVAPYLALIL